MGRHATVAGRQATQAAARGKLFTRLARDISLAAKSGGDVAMNPKLRLAVDRAKANNMPKDNIERAIKKGTGELDGMTYEEVTYEGYGPGGTAILVETITDNRNRTLPEIKGIFAKNGGNLGEMGCVGWMFNRKGVIELDSNKAQEEQVMEIALDVGAEDVATEEGYIVVYTSPAEFENVRNALSVANVPIENAEITLVPENTVSVDEEQLKVAQTLVEKLEEQDDVSNVYTNIG